MCVLSFAKSGESAAAAGAAAATTATGTSARAKFVAKFMSKAPGIFRRKLAFQL
jgi:hypothetical protein